jgi:tetratricopeptide (TPR) repeat protein
LKADALARANSDYIGSMELWRGLIRDYPKRPECWVPYGNALRTVGKRDDCIAALRRAIELNPAFAPAWISLADLKTFRFSLSDIGQIERALTRLDLPTDDRTNLHFALGKAHADVNAFEKSFHCFARANAIRRLAVKHDPDVLTVYVARCKQVFTSELFQKFAGSGSGRPDPIFLVGMPRAGSTLVEQILASHSQIEGTSELADLATLSRDIQNLATEQNQKFPDVICRADADFLHRYGERYLAMTQIHRKSGRPFFTDKMGANFAHVGLIHLILPGAKIIDVRRHPMACCFSNFSHVFQDNAYRLTDMARLYCDYVELMAHFDAVLPGRVHRIFYEELVSNPEAEIRRTLDYLGLGFEDACLNFFDTERAVTTMSAQQVRRPIYREALEYWRNYEPWLGSLKSALGPVYEMYPKVPAFG